MARARAQESERDGSGPTTRRRAPRRRRAVGRRKHGFRAEVNALARKSVNNLLTEYKDRAQ